MKLNGKKTKVMYNGKGQYKNVVIDGETMNEYKQNFSYLGSTKTSNGDCCQPDILKRICMAKRKIIDLKNIGKIRTSPFLPLKVKKL